MKGRHKQCSRQDQTEVSDASPRLWAEERQSLIARERRANTSVRRQIIYHPKVERLALEADTLLWVFHSKYPRTGLTSQQRMDHRCSHALKLKLQLFLGLQPHQTAQDLALPQLKSTQSTPK